MRRLYLAAFALLLLAGAAAPGWSARAQEPLPTLVITTPTPTATPGPSAAETALARSAGDVYLVRAGDTLLTVALEMGLDVDEMGCVLRPDFDPSQPLVIGDALLPLPLGTLCHRTTAADTLRSVAEQYGVGPESIRAVAWNGPAAASPGLDEPLPAGRYLRIPLGTQRGFDAVVIVGQAVGSGGTERAAPFLTWMLAQPSDTLPQEVLGQGGARVATTVGPAPADWPYGTGVFAWPAYGLLTQGYRYDHRAIDIAAPSGAPVTASDRGVVIRAGWNQQGYGQFVIIDHNIDYLTLYAHLDTIFVQEGEVVAAGQVIGTVGATGNATGPHLHFEIRDFGRLTNPLELLAQ